MAEGDHPPLRPTVVAIPPRRAPEPKAPVAALATPAPPGPATPRPTAIVGIERSRIPVAAADLRRLSPGVAAATVERAMALIAGVVPEKASERRAVLWGHEAQLVYAQRAAEALDLAGDPSLERARAYVARTIEILSSLDLVGAASPGGRGLTAAVRALGGRADTAAEVGHARGELDHLGRLMAGALDDLLDLKERIEVNAAALEELGREGEAASLAALFLAGHLRPTRPAVADRFEERALSLAQMAAQLREHRGLREAQLAQPLRLIGAMQHVALVALPGLLGSLAAFGLAGATVPTLTEAGEAQRRAREIIQSLNA